MIHERVLFFGRNHGFEITLRSFARLAEAMGDLAHTIVQVIVSDDHHGEPDTLEALAEKAGLPWCAAPSNDVNAPAFVARLSALAPTLAITVQFPQLYQAPLRAITPRGCLNIHRGWPLRGGSIDERAILEGLRTYAVILHQVTDRIDAGPILASRSIEISDQEAGYSLAKKADAAGETLFVEAFLPLLGRQIPAGAPQKLSQTRYANKGAVPSMCDLREPAWRLERLARALEHPRKQGLRLLVGQQSVRLRRVEVRQGVGEPGVVLAAEQDDVELACGTGSLRILTGEVDGGQVSLQQLFQECGWGVGDNILTMPAAKAR